jgi:hypothetical protein
METMKSSLLKEFLKFLSLQYGIMLEMLITEPAHRSVQGTDGFSQSLPGSFSISRVPSGFATPSSIHGTPGICV